MCNLSKERSESPYFDSFYSFRLKGNAGRECDRQVDLPVDEDCYKCSDNASSNNENDHYGYDPGCN